MTSQNTPAILESFSKTNGWRTLWKNDGTDYPALLQSFLAGELAATEFKKDYSTSVHQADALGRRFIFKHYYKLEPRPEKRLWHRLAGTFIRGFSASPTRPYATAAETPRIFF